jgi:hypothetical protein
MTDPTVGGERRFDRYEGISRDGEVPFVFRVHPEHERLCVIESVRRRKREETNKHRLA